MAGRKRTPPIQRCRRCCLERLAATAALEKVGVGTGGESRLALNAGVICMGSDTHSRFRTSDLAV